MRRVKRLLPWIAAIILAACLPSAASALSATSYEEQSLLTADGTLHVVRAGTAVDLGVTDVAASASNYVIDWTSRGQDGTVTTAIIPGTDSDFGKTGLHLAFDEQTSTLLLIWTEYIAPFSQIQVAVLRNGVWTNTALLPNTGLSGAYNPQMIVTHQPVSWLDENDNAVTATASILNVMWWEDAQYGQARLATLFLDEGSFDPSAVAVYDLPTLLGGGGETSYRGIPTGAYLFPSLEADGLSGGLIASFADLHDQMEKVVRIRYPSDRGKPSQPGNLKWQRRHIPIVGIASEGPIARMTPMLAYNASPDSAVGTSIGAGYKPTMYWRDGASLKYVRLDGADWTPVRSVAIDDTTTYDKALALVTGMGSRN
jgi:hypothetical protein